MQGEEGLKDRSRNPKRMSNKMKPKYGKIIIELCKRKANIGKKVNASLIKRYLDIPYSVNAIRRVMKEHGYMKINKTKKERKRDLRERKKRYNAFSKLQIDIKYLDDIPELYYEYKHHKLPRYQITTRLTCRQDASLRRSGLAVSLSALLCAKFTYSSFSFVLKIPFVFLPVLLNHLPLNLEVNQNIQQ